MMVGKRSLQKNQIGQSQGLVKKSKYIERKFSNYFIVLIMMKIQPDKETR